MQELAASYASTRLTVDVYCLQHPDRYCVSAKSLAAHLTGLCWTLAHDGDQRGLGELQRWLNGRVELTKPPLPSGRGDLTIADLAAAGREGYRATLDAWARSTWTAYEPLHGTAEAWIREALSRPNR